MLLGGLLSALTILFSQAFQQEAHAFLTKVKTEKTDASGGPEKKIVVAAPSEAVPSGQATDVSNSNPSFICEILPEDEHALEQPIVDKKVLTDFFKTLFRAFISPQAP